MTNTLTISRETLAKCLRDALTIRFEQDSHVEELRALLAAPVVERQAVPVYQVCNGVDGWIDVELLRYTACSLDPEDWEIRTLYTSPPAPVAVVLDNVEWIRSAARKWFYASFDCDLLELMEKHNLIAQAEGFSISVMADLELELEEAYRNACLDKVKEMNQ